MLLTAYECSGLHLEAWVRIPLLTNIFFTDSTILSVYSLYIHTVYSWDSQLGSNVVYIIYSLTCFVFDQALDYVQYQHNYGYQIKHTEPLLQCSSINRIKLVIQRKNGTLSKMWTGMKL